MKRRAFLNGAIATMSALALPGHARLNDCDWSGRAFPEPGSRESSLEPCFQYPFVCKVVSIGSAGHQIVTSQMGRLLGANRVIAIDTDAHALHAAMANEKILLDYDAETISTQGKLAPAERSAWEARQRIESSLAGAHMVFVVAGMGGGTGSGVAPVIVEIAKQVSTVIAVVNTPFPDEGVQSVAVAGNAMIRLHRRADSVIEIPNGRLFDRVRQANPRMQVAEFYRYARRAFGEVYAATAGSILHPGPIAVDFEDVRAAFASGHIASVGWGVADSWVENAAVMAAQVACNHPLLGEDRIAQASGLIVSIATDSVGRGDVAKVWREIRRRTKGNPIIIVAADEFDVPAEGIDVRIIALA